MNQILTSLTTNQCEHPTSIRSHTRVTSILTMLVVLTIGATCLGGCSKNNSDPDYISQLDNISPEFEQKYLLPEDNEYKDKDLKAMIWDSKDLITTGTYQNATTLRVRERSNFSLEIPNWFLKRGFTCGALTALAGKYLDPAALPHVYRKGNTLIHVFRYWASRLPQDKISGSHVWIIAVIQYKNVTQNFYPCQGDKIAVPGINYSSPIIKHQDGHVTIDHTIANKAWKARLQMEEGK